MSVCQLYEDVYTGVPRRASLYCRKPGPSHHSTHTLIYTHRVSFFFSFRHGVFRSATGTRTVTVFSVPGARDPK